MGVPNKLATDCIFHPFNYLFPLHDHMRAAQSQSKCLLQQHGVPSSSQMIDEQDKVQSIVFSSETTVV
jgi:hypothetical protein